jgi:glycosyltransferase involved in cell wall biosynthesis
LLPNDYRLEIVGTGPYYKKLAQLIKKLGINDRVSFHHDLPRDVLIEMYARAGMVILLSRYESFGIVIAEALASKTPCLVTNTSALVEWIDNINCYGVGYPVDVGQLAALIKKVTGKIVRRPKLWDWEMVSRETEDFYSSLT